MHAQVIRMTLLALLTCACGQPDASPLSPDEQVMFLPTASRVLADGRAEVAIDAWVYENEQRMGLSRAFARHLGLDLDAMPSAERELFLQRTQLFRVDSETRKDVRIRFADGTEYALPRTGRGGRSRARITTTIPSGADPVRLAYDAVMPADDARRFSGAALLVPAQGLSVISDIDDTIRQSQVRDRRALLLGTFARAFVAVPGMAERYRAIAAQSDSTRFHYVSSGPIQLYPPIADFLRDGGFPAGSVHLRETTSFRAALGGLPDSRTHKLAVIRGLLADFPQRRFVLVGDSGEHDPEIYAQIARDHPARIAAIAIRDVSGESRAAPRYADTFAGVAPERWEIFSTTEDWPPLAPD